MEAIILLGAVKLVIDFFEDNWTGVATGILLAGVPGSELCTLGDSVYYLFDLNGNRIGTKNISNIKEVPYHRISLKNEKDALIGFNKAKKDIGFQKSNKNIGFNKK